MFKRKKILCVSAHMDDAEFGCGGLISSLSRESDIYVLVLSKDRKNSLGEVQEVRVLEEQYAAMNILGVKKENIFLPDGIPGQLFPEYRQNVLEAMYDVDSKIRPDIVITPSMNDVHQDHRTVCRSAQKAFNRRTRLAYEVINSSDGFVPTLFFEISKDALDAKAEAILCYRSQADPAVTSAHYFDRGAIESLARLRGVRMGVQYAESYEVMNLVRFQGE
ncbi:MAG TPA: PIG-L family deacetylase [Syntrophorhabdaceae bacterium]|nr:PIG-L family deacetylase [Syntrophorhabdaceae bacterium]